MKKHYTGKHKRVVFFYHDNGKTTCNEFTYDTESEAEEAMVASIKRKYGDVKIEKKVYPSHIEWWVEGQNERYGDTRPEYYITGFWKSIDGHPNDFGDS